MGGSGFPTRRPSLSRMSALQEAYPRAAEESGRREKLFSKCRKSIRNRSLGLNHDAKTERAHKRKKGAPGRTAAQQAEVTSGRRRIYPWHSRHNLRRHDDERLNGRRRRANRQYMGAVHAYFPGLEYESPSAHRPNRGSRELKYYILSKVSSDVCFVRGERPCICFAGLILSYQSDGT